MAWPLVKFYVGLSLTWCHSLLSCTFMQRTFIWSSESRRPLRCKQWEELLRDLEWTLWWRRSKIHRRYGSAHESKVVIKIKSLMMWCRSPLNLLSTLTMTRFPHMKDQKWTVFLNLTKTNMKTSSMLCKKRKALSSAAPQPSTMIFMSSSKMWEAHFNLVVKTMVTKNTMPLRSLECRRDFLKA